MKRDNPAVYECKTARDDSKLHHWRIQPNGMGMAKCDRCGLRLTLEQTKEVFGEHYPK